MGMGLSVPRLNGGWLKGKRVLVMGIGTRQGGLGVTRFLVNAGAEVTVTDLRGPDDLEATLREMRHLPITYRLGEHREEDFASAEIVVRNPGVPAESPWLAIARRHGAAIEMEMSLFLRACPSPVIGITGTKGKTTTSTLCAAILSQWRSDTVLAGNMGRSALAELDGIGADTPVVLELSSFQLESLGEHRISPHIAVFTNFSADHLNRYPSMDAYLDAKLNIARFQGPADWFVLNQDDVVWQHREAGDGTAIGFSLSDDGSDGAHLRDGRLLWRLGGVETDLLSRDELALQGNHNLANALAALAAALLAGAKPAHVRQALRTAGSVPDRQEFVAEIDGLRYVNDTTATTPAAVYAALERFGGSPLVVIAGGSAKNVDLDELAARLARAGAAIVLLDGAATPALQRLLGEHGANVVRGPFDSMDSAIDEARRLALQGSVVLLSPGCASFGMFRDEFHRGQAFRDAVARIQQESHRGART